MFPDGAFGRYLSRRGILLKDAGKFFERETEAIIRHAKTSAEQAGRPYAYLESAHTHASGQSKEAKARAIAERDGITEGLVGIFSVLEPVRASLAVAGNHKTHRLEVVRRNRRCLHLYWYLIHPEFGWMHVRIQTWYCTRFRLTLNGREWMCKQLQQNGVAFERSDNKIVSVADFAGHRNKLTGKFNHTDWPSFLICQVAMVNPATRHRHRRVRRLLVWHRSSRTGHRHSIPLPSRFGTIPQGDRHRRHHGFRCYRCHALSRAENRITPSRVR